MFCFEAHCVLRVVELDWRVGRISITTSILIYNQLAFSKHFTQVKRFILALQSALFFTATRKTVVLFQMCANIRKTVRIWIQNHAKHYKTYDKVVLMSNQTFNLYN